MLGRRAGVPWTAGIKAALMAAVFTASATGPVRAQVPPSTTTSLPPVTVVAPTSSTTTTTTSTPTSTTVAPSISTSSSVPETTTSFPPGTTATTSSTIPPTGDDAPPGPPAPSVSDSTVSAFLDSLERTPASSTGALMDALRPLQDLGMTPQEAAMLGMGRFPVGGEAYFRDDFLEFRAGPPVHGHQGNDIWAAFDTPVRAPADGVVRFEEGGLGGKAAYVTEPDGTFYYLAHLNGYAPELSSGMHVRTGQLIGFNGDSGNARGGPPHVHFEIHPYGGAAVNPKLILDQWLADALAAVPALLSSYVPTTGGGRPLSAVGLARHFDGGLLSGPERGSAEEEDAGAVEARVLAEALVGPLTPPVLRGRDAPALG